MTTMMGLETMSPTLAELLFSPLLPWWALAVCLVVFALLAWRTYAGTGLSLPRRLLLFSLRLGAFALLCWILLQPVRRTVETTVEKPSVAVIVDVSASMEDRLPGVERTRAEMARAVLSSPEVRRLERRYRVLPFALGEDLARLPLAEEGLESLSSGLSFEAGQSRLVPSLRELRGALKAERPFAALLLTDGLDTSGLGADGLLLDLPLVIPELEDASQIRQDTTQDFSLTLPDSDGPRRVVRGWRTELRASVNRLRGQGAVRVPVTLSLDGREVERREVDLPEDARYAQVTFELTPDQLGSFVYRVAIAPPEDSDEGNNSGDVALEVIDEENRVLYLEGLTRQEFKFMKRALLKERSFRAAVYLRTGNGVMVNFEEGGGGGVELASLLSEKSLSQCKALILGEFTSDSFSAEQLQAVRQFVERGGGLLLCGASRAYGKGGYLEADGLGALSPVTSQDGASMDESRPVALTFTAAGRNDDAFRLLASEAVFTPLRSLWQPVRLSEGAQSLLESAESAPVLAVRRYGAGRVAILLSNTLHTLRLGGTAGAGASVYDRLVCQTVSWLLPDRNRTEAGDALQVLLRTDHADVGAAVAVGALSGRQESAADLTCVVTQPDGKTLSLPMQEATLGAQVGLSSARKGFQSEFRASQLGTYALEIAHRDGRRSQRRLLVVRRPAIELTGAPVNRALLRRLAEDSGGRWVALGHRGELFEGLAAPERRLETVRETSLWDRWLWLAPLMALFCLEWYWRRRWELV